MELSWEYVGEELAIFWINPYPCDKSNPLGGQKEKIISFWWPLHPAHKSLEVERTFEAMAECFVKAWAKKQKLAIQEYLDRMEREGNT